MNRLDDHLVLNRYFHALLGAESFDELKSLLRPVDEGPGDDGQSHFFGRLVMQPGLKIEAEDLRGYDSRVLAFEGRLAKARAEFRGFRYFQYLAALYSEMMLDRLTDDPARLLSDLNTFLSALRREVAELANFPDFEADDLRRMAFFMATGGGKTLLMHVNIWQMMHYLEHGRHPEARQGGNGSRIL